MPCLLSLSLLSYFLIQSREREMLAGCSFNCTAYMWDRQTNWWPVCQPEVDRGRATACMQYVIKGYKCFTMLRRTTYKVRSQSNVSTTEISTQHILDPIPANIRQTHRRKDLFNKLNPHDREISTQHGVEDKL